MTRCGKVRHAVREAAIDAAFALLLSQREAGHRPVNVYRCRACDGWHVGHRPKVLPAPRPVGGDTVSVEVDRCACHCKKLATHTVPTPRGGVRCCDRHAKRLSSAYAKVTA